MPENKLTCPKCQQPVPVEVLKVKEGDVLTCAHCGASIPLVGDGWNAASREVSALRDVLRRKK